MRQSWQEIHALEVSEDYPAAIDALEERLREEPDDAEAVVRLAFNLWYVVAERDGLGTQLPLDPEQA
jgi:hypothetical protein